MVSSRTRLSRTHADNVELVRVLLPLVASLRLTAPLPQPVLTSHQLVVTSLSAGLVHTRTRLVRPPVLHALQVRVLAQLVPLQQLSVLTVSQDSSLQLLVLLAQHAQEVNIRLRLVRQLAAIVPQESTL
jgi:hypothetical protein